jgi:glycosyltransferase involved in cell wall biosynthesis
MLRVLQIGPLPPPWGGVESNLDAIHHYLIGQGHQAVRLNITRHRQASTDTALYPSSARETLWLIYRQPADILHLHVGGNYSRRLQALSLAMRIFPCRKTVLSFHSGGYPSSPEGRRATSRSLLAWSARCFDAVIVVNEEMRAFFLRLGLPPSRCHLILPFALTQPASELEPGPLADFLARHSPVIAGVGGLEPEYDLPTQLRAFELLQPHFPQAGLLWIGRGSQEESLRQLVSASPAAQSVAIMGDVPRPYTLTAISRAALLWRSTLYDGDAISIREALHLGTPVVASDNGMRPAGVQLFPIGDHAALAQVSSQLLQAPAHTPAALSDGRDNLAAIVSLYQSLLR